VCSSDLLAKHLPILVDVSQAVAFAHSRGIIHRDVKPSQVMLGEFGEVLLMDWGLSLIYDLELVKEQAPKFANVDYTPDGKYASSPAGTPAYMAPEQTHARASKVGPWTDIYLLGGTLYYILTGTSPNKGSDSTEAFEFATGDVVEPPEVRVRSHEIPGELSRLAMRALKRETGERLPSAIDFIKGIRSFLTGAGKRTEAVELVQRANDKFKGAWDNDYHELDEAINLIERSIALWPENDNAYRLRQQILVRYTNIAIDSRDLKLARLQAERLDPSPERKELLSEIQSLEDDQRLTDERIEDAQREVKQARVRAENARNEAEDLVRYMLQDLFVNLQVIKRTDVLDNVAKRALDYFEQNPDKDQTEETLEARAITLKNIGNVFAGRGKVDEAMKAFNDSHSIYQVLFRREPENNRWRLALSNHHELMADLNLQEDNLNNALRSARIALDIRTRLSNQNPHEVEYKSALGASYDQEANILFHYDQPEAALESFSKARSIREAVYRDHPHDDLAKNQFAESYLNEAKVYLRLSELNKAEMFVKKSIEMRDELHKKNPSDRRTSFELAESIDTSANIYEHNFRYGDAEGEYRKSLTLYDDLYYNDPTNPVYQLGMIRTLMGVGRCLVDKGQQRDAMDLYERGITIERQMITTQTRFHDRDYFLFLKLYLEVTEVFLDYDSYRDARKCAKIISFYFEKLGNPKPDTPDIALLRAKTLILAGRISNREHNLSTAMKVWESACTMLMPFVEISLQPSDIHAWYVRVLIYLDRQEEAKKIMSELRTTGYKNCYYMQFLKRNKLLNI